MRARTFKMPDLAQTAQPTCCSHWQKNNPLVHVCFDNCCLQTIFHASQASKVFGNVLLSKLHNLTFKVPFTWTCDVSQKTLRMILTEPLAKFIDYGNAVFEGDKKSGNPRVVSIALLQQLRMDRRAKDSANEILLEKMVGISFERLYVYPGMWGLYIVNHRQPA